MISPRRSASLFAVALVLAGCKRDEVVVYTAPKDAAPPDTAPAAAPSAPVASATPRPQRPQPRFTWKLPPGWQESGAGQMSVASFSIQSDAGQAMVNITPLPPMSGKEPVIVNMWREQVGQPALSPADAQSALTPVDVGEEKGQLFEAGGSRDGKSTKIITAMVHHPDASWFYKLAGDEAVVNAQKPAFIEFLRSIRMSDSPAAAPSGADSPAKP